MSSGDRRSAATSVPLRRCLGDRSLADAVAYLGAALGDVLPLDAAGAGGERVVVGGTGAAPAQVQAAIQRAERDRAHADVERLCQVTERAEARRLLREADHDERRANEVRSAADHEPGPEPDQRLGAAVEAGQRETTSIKCVRTVEPSTAAEGATTPSSGPSLRVKRTGLTW